MTARLVCDALSLLSLLGVVSLTLSWFMLSSGLTIQTCRPSENLASVTHTQVRKVLHRAPYFEAEMVIALTKDSSNGYGNR